MRHLVAALVLLALVAPATATARGARAVPPHPRPHGELYRTLPQISAAFGACLALRGAGVDFGTTTGTFTLPVTHTPGNWQAGNFEPFLIGLVVNYGSSFNPADDGLVRRCADHAVFARWPSRWSR